MVCNLTSIRELDELPDGTEIELQDKRGTRRRKVDGHWRWPGKDETSTWDLNTYVNTRRYGARVVQRGATQ
ncbi:hypothetical protein KGG77_gp20 [Streptomyces phage Omar]|uniref:Uncharacterized protein n=1 Tax=Streptomyces phage Omar TaxID=2059882 RepID=A0A2H5BLN4_9CAUD|nr:hypothetical protein KGG77_gp20 [Streptomyces phage Omar]AUG87248.1 hypothetical protein SEA_OMAR_64 [Streptomyces phage Omar]